MAAEAAGLKAAVGGTLTDVVADWLVPQYVLAAREQLSTLPQGAERWKVLRLTASDLVALRRGDHSAARLALESKKFEEELRQRRVAEERQRKGPPQRQGLSPETLQRIEQELHLL